MTKFKSEEKTKKESSMWAKMVEKAIGLAVSNLTREGMKSVPESFSKLRKWWNGKSIAVIGPTASGKNSLFDKLKREVITKEYIQTRGVNKIEDFKFHFPLSDKTQVKFTCKRSLNVGGEVDQRNRHWLETCKNADIIFYLVDYENLRNNPKSVKNRIKDDLKWLATNIPNLKSDMHLHLLLNKVDIIENDPDIANIESNIREETKDNIDEVEEIARKVMNIHFKKITGISPISMTDDYLFSLYFTHVLESIFSSVDG